jgi:hypothetical protein
LPVVPPLMPALIAIFPPALRVSALPLVLTALATVISNDPPVVVRVELAVVRSSRVSRTRSQWSAPVHWSG